MRRKNQMHFTGTCYRTATTLWTKQVVKQQESVPGSISRYSTALIFYPLISTTKIQFIDHHLTYCMIPCVNMSQLILSLLVNICPIYVICPLLVGKWKVSHRIHWTETVQDGDGFLFIRVKILQSWRVSLMRIYIPEQHKTTNYTDPYPTQ